MTGANKYGYMIEQAWQGKEESHKCIKDYQQQIKHAEETIAKGPRGDPAVKQSESNLKQLKTMLSGSRALYGKCTENERDFMNMIQEANELEADGNDDVARLLRP